MFKVYFTSKYKNLTNLNEIINRINRSQLNFNAALLIFGIISCIVLSITIDNRTTSDTRTIIGSTLLLLILLINILGVISRDNVSALIDRISLLTNKPDSITTDTNDEDEDDSDREFLLIKERMLSLLNNLMLEEGDGPMSHMHSVINSELHAAWIRKVMNMSAYEFYNYNDYDSMLISFYNDLESKSNVLDTVIQSSFVNGLIYEALLKDLNKTKNSSTVSMQP